MQIRLLDQHTAELIAAGEVVERPSSVVKELMENAIDSGATSIQVEIEGGGIRLIRVQDNGSGIEAEEIPLAFLRHATSKVRTKEDLDTIHTLGFRGEALASIASVSKVELLTKSESAEFASLYRIEGGKEQGLEAGARPLGTTMAVHSLFYNTPARMKFLKKDTSEGTFVTETVTRLALSHPNISFRYTRDGKNVFHTPGDGELKSTLYAVLGGDFARDLLEVSSSERYYSVSGLVTSPLAARASRSMQFFFINGRFVKNGTMMAALEQAYRGTTMQGKFPGCVLFLQMPPELVDVNVHPAKTEVRFAKEKEIFDVIYKAVKSSLLQNMTMHGSIELKNAVSGFVNKNEEALPTIEQTQIAQNQYKTSSPSYEEKKGQWISSQALKNANHMVNTLASESSFAPYERSSPIDAPHFTMDYGMTSIDKKPLHNLSIEPEDVESYDGVSVNKIARGETTPVVSTAGVEKNNAAIEDTKNRQEQQIDGEPTLQYIGEIFRTYILATAGDTFCLIDKHAAHERMIYEELLQTTMQPDAQMLLSPVTVTLSAAEKNALLTNKEVLEASGIELEDFGGNGVLIRSVPADVEPNSIADLVIEIAGRLSVNAKDTANEKAEWVLHSVACRAAIKAGDKTHPKQLLALAELIVSNKIPPFCPHGRPVVLELTRKEIEKQFGRLG